MSSLKDRVEEGQIEKVVSATDLVMRGIECDSLKESMMAETTAFEGLWVTVGTQTDAIWLPKSAMVQQNASSEIPLATLTTQWAETDLCPNSELTMIAARRDCLEGRENLLPHVRSALSAELKMTRCQLSAVGTEIRHSRDIQLEKKFWRRPQREMRQTNIIRCRDNGKSNVVHRLRELGRGACWPHINCSRTVKGRNWQTSISLSQRFKVWYAWIYKFVVPCSM